MCKYQLVGTNDIFEVVDVERDGYGNVTKVVLRSHGENKVMAVGDLAESIRDGQIVPVPCIKLTDEYRDNPCFAVVTGDPARGRVTCHGYPEKDRDMLNATAHHAGHCTGFVEPGGQYLAIWGDEDKTKPAQSVHCSACALAYPGNIVKPIER